MRNRFRVFLFFCIAVLIVIPVFAQDETGISTEEGLSAAQNVTLDFKDADIQNVLKIISYKSGVNIVTTPDVVGSVTIRLVDVPWDRALDVILKTYGYGYERQANIILVTKMENISKIQSEEPLTTEIFHLKFLDAQDAQKILIPLMSPRGKISVLYARGQKGWQFGTFKIGAEDAGGEGLVREAADRGATETISIEKTAAGDFVSRKADFNPSVKSRILVITDTVASLERIRTEILPVVDKKPKQVLIETRLMEVNEDDLRDLGVDWGIGSITQAESSTLTTEALKGGKIGLGVQSLGAQATPSVFGPKSTEINAIEPFDAGLEFVFQKLSGTKFEAIIHALEENTSTNTLSAPRILTLDNQEAAILVGYHTPILKSTVTAGDSGSGTGATITQDLDYYQEIGIRLNVVPQINQDGYINMIVHPSV
ncbi:MAG: secretin and TonB N-terminal domain-containing protein, partial [Candidatus Omnitrophota bacterium]